MELIEYSVPEFSETQDIKNLLQKLGFDKSFLDGAGGNFFSRGKEELKHILEVARKMYKRLCIEVHPRAIGDSEEDATKLHTLMRVIEERFEYILNRRLISGKEIKDYGDLMECACGCEQTFPPEKLKNGQYKKYFNKKCRKKARQTRKTEKARKLRRPINREEFPLVTCICGCGTRFRQQPRHNLKIYFNDRCRRLMLYKKKKLDGTLKIESKEVRAERWKKYYEKKWGNITKTAEFIKCECGCGRELRKIPCGKSLTGFKRWFENKCKDKIKKRQDRKVQKNRHQNLLSILNETDEQKNVENSFDKCAGKDYSLTTV
jgi:hypothetical protein